MRIAIHHDIYDEMPVKTIYTLVQLMPETNTIRTAEYL